MHSMLHDLLIFTIAAVLVVPLFRWLKLGAILGYLLAGIVIGPGVLALVADPGAILHFSELGVVFLLFIIGLELDPGRMWRMRAQIFGMGAAQVLITACVFGIIGFSLTGNLSLAIVAGSALALSSTAFGIQLLEENHQLKTSHGQGTFAILMFQDLAVVPLLALIAFLASGGETSFTVGGFLKALAIMAAVVGFGLFGVRHFLRIVAVARVQEVFIAAALVIVVGSAILMEQAGFSMGMGAFMAGVMLANSEYRHELEGNLQPFKGLLLGLFFIAVGMSLDIDVLAGKFGIILGLAVGFMSIKMGLLFVLARVFRFPRESACNIAATIGQGGEFAFVMFSAAAAANLMTIEQVSVLNAAVIISMMLTPLIFTLNAKYLRRAFEISERPYDAIDNQDSRVIVAGFGRFGQIVSRFLVGENVPHTILDHSAEQVEAARRFGNKVYYGDASNESIMHAAGAGSADILILAIDNVDSSIETAAMVRKLWPNLKIIARARNRRHVISLMELGIEQIYRETYHSSLAVAKDLLIALGQQPQVADRRIAVFREHDEKLLQDQYKLRDDEAGLMSHTAQANRQLALLLSADSQGSDVIPTAAD